MPHQEVDLSETLVVVTADHSHVMTMNGYPIRGNDILGLTGQTAPDGIGFTTLMFTNGPGYNYTVQDGMVSQSWTREVKKIELEVSQLL